MPYFDYKKNFFVFIPFFKIANMEKTIYTFSLFLLLACGRKETITPLNISRDIQLSRKIQIQEKCFSNGIYRDSVLFFIAECSPEDRYIYMSKKFSVMEKKAGYSTNSTCLFFTGTVNYTKKIRSFRYMTLTYSMKNI